MPRRVDRAFEMITNMFEQISLEKQYEWQIHCTWDWQESHFVSSDRE